MDAKRYTRLRDELALFRKDFERQATNLRCDRLMVFNRVLPEGWQHFVSVNRSRVEAEQWVVLPQEEGCLRFRGDLSDLDPFFAVARSAWLILARIALEFFEMEVDLGPLDHEFGWLDRVFHTGESVASARLHIEGSWWEWEREDSPDAVLSDAAIWVGDDITRYHKHPMVQRLPFDVFRASAEAIRVWLHHDAPLTVADRIDELGIRLPNFGAESGGSRRRS